jgi:hypothetical protein
MRLPTEIDLMLLPMLDLASLMNLTTTNRSWLSLAFQIAARAVLY